MTVNKDLIKKNKYFSTLRMKQIESLYRTSFLMGT